MILRRRLGLAFWCSALLVTLLAAPAAGESPALLVADLVPSQPSAASNPLPVAELGGVGFFIAEDATHGTELWRTEGTPETTRLLMDFCPGTCHGYPGVGVVGGQLFVYATTGEGSALFTSDGTSAGTRLVHRFLDPVTMSGSFVDFDGRAWFVFISAQPYGYQLWQSDGTAAGTAPWPVDCGQGCQPISSFLATAGDELFFAVTTPTGNGYRLWRTDGTVAGTRPAEANCPPSCPTIYSPVGVAGSHYYFNGRDAEHGFEVWVAGGGLPTPRLVTDLSPGPASSNLEFSFAFGDAAWFHVLSTGVARWYRFTPEGGTVATEVEPLGPAKAPSAVWPVGDRLYFTVADGPTKSLWTVWPGVEPARLLVSGLQTIHRVGELDYGVALLQVFQPGETRARLLASDGTVAGTHEIAGPSPSASIRPSVAVGGGILIAADDGTHGSEPWVSDGTAAGTRPLGDLRQGAATSPGRLTAVGDELVFALGTPGTGALYAVAAPPGGPPAARQLLAGGSLGPLASSGGTLFATQVSAGSWHLITVDPATGAAEPIFTGGLPIPLTPWRGGVAFGEYGDDEPLWWSDGTGAGTQKIRDLFPGWTPFCDYGCVTPPPYPTEMTPLGERLYMVAVDEWGDNLWTSDGTTPGTVPLIHPQAGSYALASQLTPFAGGVAFLRWGLSPGSPTATAVWTSRGTVESTAALFTVSGETQLLGALGSRLIYSQRSGGADAILATDGTAAGTTVLHDLGGAAVHPRVRSQRSPWVTAAAAALVVGQRLFFTVADDVAGEELWVSDGTAAGTRRVADLRPGNIGSHPQSLTAYRGCALFTANDGVAGYEPWASSGVTAWRVADVAPGVAASSPAEIVPAGGFVYFTADDGTYGREAFAVSTAELDTRCATQPPLNGPPPGSLTSAEAPGFAFLVKFGPNGTASTGSPAPCVAGTVCVTATAGGRGDVFLRMVPTSPGRLSPAIVKLTPEEVDVTVYQLATGVQRSYELTATVPPSDVLAGAFGRDAFATANTASTTFEPMALRANEPAGAKGGARWFKPRDIPGYRFKAWLIDAAGKRTAVRAEGCVQATLCLSGPVRGRTDVLVRLLDRRPAVARLTGTGLEVWVERTKTGELRKFLLPAEGAPSTSLNGVLDPVGFRR